MAKQVQVNQTSREEKVYPLDFTPALLDGVDVTGATLFYVSDNAVDDPPELDDVTDGNMVYVSVKNLDIGFHRVRCVAATTNSDLSPEIELLITVKT